MDENKATLVIQRFMKKLTKNIKLVKYINEELDDLKKLNNYPNITKTYLVSSYYFLTYNNKYRKSWFNVTLSKKMMILKNSDRNSLKRLKRNEINRMDFFNFQKKFNYEDLIKIGY